MNIELTEKEFRRLLDMVYVGNWVLNSIRDDDRFEDYDELEEKIFSLCLQHGMRSLVQRWRGRIYPSRAYEDAVFFDILAEELARRDMDSEHLSPDDVEELNTRMEEYISEFEKNGIENIKVDN
jgi:hypothetical protein